MSRLASVLVGLAGRASYRRFLEATEDADRTQSNKLRQILDRNRDTDYGIRHGFASLGTLDEYRARVPVVTYDDISAQVERAMKGESNVLTAEDPVMFAQTSGTTGATKYIPITATCQGRDHSDQMRSWIYAASRDHPRIFQGRVISMVSPAVEGKTSVGIPYGSTSGHVYQNMPRVVRSTYAIPYDVFLISDYHAKYYTLMRIALAGDVTFIGTANPSSVLKMVEFGDEFSEGMIRDLHDGTLDRDLDIAPDLRRRIEGGLVPNRKRAALLTRCRALRSGRLRPGDYWPELALIGCWKGGTVGSYLPKLEPWFDPDGRGMTPIRDWGYLSSGARGSIPLSDTGSAGVLTVNANLFELVPVEDVEEHPDDSSQWSFPNLRDAEVGREYYVILTTTGGLYRYDINDVIEVVGRFQGTPTVVFKRKGRGMSNITGEKLSVNQVIAAFERVCSQQSVTIDHFKVEADFEGSRYVIKVESSSHGSELGLPFLTALDLALSEANIEYAAKRKSQRLKDPELQVMQPGWYERQKRRLAAAGHRLFQAKTILLDAKVGYVAEPEETEKRIGWRS